MNRYKILIALMVTTLLFFGCAQQHKVVRKDITKKSVTPPKVEKEEKKQEQAKQQPLIEEKKTIEKTLVKKTQPKEKKKVKKPISEPIVEKKEHEAVVEKKPVKKDSIKTTAGKKTTPEKKQQKEVTPPPVAKKTAPAPEKEIAKESALQSNGTKIHQIIIPNKKKSGSSKFKPDVLRIRAGETIVWINKDTRTHFINQKPAGYTAFSSYGDDDDDDDEIEEDNLDINSQVLQKREKWQHTFRKKGTINYYCYTHPMEMFGTIIVE